MGAVLYEGLLFPLSSLHSMSKNMLVFFKKRMHLLSNPTEGPLCCIFLCGLISLIQILPRQQLLNRSYLQEETHLFKFYKEAAHNEKNMALPDGR